MAAALIMGAILIPLIALLVHAFIVEL